MSRNNIDKNDIEIFYELKINLIKIAIIIVWLMIIGLAVTGYFSKNFNKTIWQIFMLSVITNTGITIYPWKKLLKENENHIAFFLITTLFICVVSVINYLQHTERLLPFVLIIIFSSIFYDTKKYVTLAVLSTVGLIVSILFTNNVDVIIVEVTGLLIFSYLCYYLAMLYKNEAISRFNKSEELANKVDRLKQLDIEKKGLIKKLMSVQEEERKRISRELHDEIGQTLNSLLITLETSYKKVDDKQVKDNLEIAINEFQGAIAEIERMIWSLRPTILDDLGLIPAIRSLTKRYIDRMGLDIKFKSNVEASLSSDIETVLYRFTQEAMNNIIKHSKADKIKIEICHKDSNVKIVVNDNGIGFAEKGDLNKFSGIGLKGMKERLSIFGGNLNIITSGKGTTLEAIIPL